MTEDDLRAIAEYGYEEAAGYFYVGMAGSPGYNHPTIVATIMVENLGPHLASESPQIRAGRLVIDRPQPLRGFPSGGRAARVNATRDALFSNRSHDFAMILFGVADH